MVGEREREREKDELFKREKTESKIRNGNHLKIWREELINEEELFTTQTI